MGKISPISIKYLIKIKFFASGIVEKPDVIGAIFGQTEGLLGEELELRELQKKGKIGRIEAEIKYLNEKAEGIIEIPTALNKTEATLVAAAIETIDRIGPAEAKFEILEIKDVRTEKREYIVERAKELLKKITEQIPESQEIKEAVKLKAKVSEIKEVGEEKLAAGNINDRELILVEGRADVVNLIKHGIDNVIAMNGINLPETIKRLSRRKVVTLFIDGDRGGLLLAKSALKSGAKIDYIAVAPNGKEVEELVGKEILSALRKRKSTCEFLEEIKSEKKVTKKRAMKKTEKRKIQKVERAEESEIVKSVRGRKKSIKGRKGETKIDEIRSEEIGFAQFGGKKKEWEEEEKTEEKVEEAYKKINPFLNEARGSKMCYIINKDLRLVKVLPLGNLKYMLREYIGYCLIIDGTIDDYLVDIAERNGFKIIAARNFILKRDHKAILISF